MVDLTWEIQREKVVKTGIVRLMQQEVVQELLKSTEEAPSSLDLHVRRVFGAGDAAKQWGVDLVATEEMDVKLGSEGVSALGDSSPADARRQSYRRG